MQTDTVLKRKFDAMLPHLDEHTARLYLGSEAISIGRGGKQKVSKIAGVIISMGSHIDMSFLYRKISHGYQSLYTHAFTESTYPPMKAACAWAFHYSF